MRTDYLENQISLFDQDGSYGKMSLVPSQAEQKKAPTSGLSWRQSLALKSIPFMYLDLTPGHGNLLGLYEWVLLSPWLGESTILNTGPAPPSGAAESSLWQILEVSPLPKYYLRKGACLGILRRSKERGKPLVKKLEVALKLQAGIPVKKRWIIECHLLAQSSNVAFEENQRNEVRDLHGISGALSAQPGAKQQTYVAAFSGGAGSSAGSIGYSETVAPTLKASGGNAMPTTLCLNDQGGDYMECTYDMVGTLRAQEHGHQPLIYENHGIDGRYTGPYSISPTLSARNGTGGNNLPLVEQVICLEEVPVQTAELITEDSRTQRDTAPLSLSADRLAVFSRQRTDVFLEGDVVSTESARQFKDATDLVLDRLTTDALIGIDDDTYVSFVHPPQLIRRLTPLECERLMGFPDGWTALVGAHDAPRYKALGNSVSIPCVTHIMQGLAMTQALT